MPRLMTHSCRGTALAGIVLSSGFVFADDARAQPTFSQDGHYQDHRGHPPPRLPGYRPGSGRSHYQDHRGDRPPGPRSPGYNNPYLPDSGNHATPPRGPTVDSSGNRTGGRR